MEDTNIVNYNRAGQRIRNTRQKLNMTQEELANAADVSLQFLSHIENARSKASLTTFIKLANAMGMTLDDIFCDSLEHSTCAYEKQIANAISDCTPAELEYLSSALISLKEYLRTYTSRITPSDQV